MQTSGSRPLGWLSAEMDSILSTIQRCAYSYTFCLQSSGNIWCCCLPLFENEFLCQISQLETTVFYSLFNSIDLFSLYILFSHFRPRDATRGNSFFQMSSYARANLRITNEKNKRKIPMRASRGLKWENKMYKLKRSIPLDGLIRGLERNQAWHTLIGVIWLCAWVKSWNSWLVICYKLISPLAGFRS